MDLKLSKTGCKLIRYKQVRIGPPRSLLATDALNLSCSVLGVSAPIRFFAPDGETDEPKQWNDTLRIGPPELKGCFLALGRQIWIRADQTDEQMVITIGHEMYHLWEWVNRLKDSKEISESNAETFGVELLEKLRFLYRYPDWHWQRSSHVLNDYTPYNSLLHWLGHAV